jgi:hypothetical protein
VRGYLHQRHAQFPQNREKTANFARQALANLRSLWPNKGMWEIIAAI